MCVWHSYPTVPAVPAPGRSDPRDFMYVSSATRSRGRRRAIAVLVGVAVVAVTLFVVAGALALSERDLLPARTWVGGVAVGGLDSATARERLERSAAARRLRPIELRADGKRVLTVTGALLGSQPRLDQALRAADGTGVATRLARRFGVGADRFVPLLYELDPGRVERMLDALGARLATEAEDATVEIGTVGAVVTSSTAGTAVDAGTVERRLRTLPPAVEVPLVEVEPQATTAEAQQAANTIDTLLSGPHVVAAGDTSVTLTPAFLRGALTVTPRNGRFALSIDSDALSRRLTPGFRDDLREPRDAEFRVVGERIGILPSRPGRELAVRALARSLLTDPGARVHRARFRQVAPDLTTAQARALRIREQVSSFTTYYPCCASRVTNIKRAAAILDGTVLRPGETFSLNEALGKRTVERGFVEAPQILAGRLVDAVGGGVSQVATTFFNAAFFAGLRLDDHQPHEFYISRYPMGREATVSWGGPELIFTNDWKAGLLVKVSAWDTGISVRFFSSKLGRRVETVTEEPYGYVAPRTRVIRNPALRPGERKVVQEAGPSGFTVEYTRKVYRGDKLIRDERFRQRYRAENAFVEVGPKKKPKPKPDKTGATGATGPTGASGATGPTGSGDPTS